jgi:predicted lipid-binding transport protein (Tim44 family)
MLFMKPIFNVLITLAVAVGAAGYSADADAKRLGGGKSIGRSSNVTQKQAQPPAQQGNTATPNASNAPVNQAAAKPAAASTPAVAPKRPWGAMLGGLAAGLGLAALFSAFGMGGGLAESMGSILMVLLLVGAAVFAWRMIRSRMSPAGLSPAAAGGAPLPRSRSDDVGYYRHAGAEGHTTAAFHPEEQATQTMARFGAPEGFDEAGFITTAKQHYTRLQQAWDSGNLAEIERFTSPAMYSELKEQIAQRQGLDKTDVVTLEAQLLGIEEANGEYLASVEFSGLIREETFGGATPFREVWNLARYKAGKGGWLLAGIEQMNASVH